MFHGVKFEGTATPLAEMQLGVRVRMTTSTLLMAGRLRMFTSTQVTALGHS